jgi:hypothetical protein
MTLFLPLFLVTTAFAYLSGNEKAKVMQVVIVPGQSGIGGENTIRAGISFTVETDMHIGNAPTLVWI